MFYKKKIYKNGDHLINQFYPLTIQQNFRFILTECITVFTGDIFNMAQIVPVILSKVENIIG